MKLFPGKTYSRFLIREFVKVFFVCMIFLVGLSFIVRTLEDTEKLKTFTFIQMLITRLLEAPEIISREALLASSMFAAVYTMSNLTKSREILALRSCGVSAYKIITPLILIGLLISGCSVLFEDFIVVRSFSLRYRYAAFIRGEDVQYHLRDRSNLIVFGEKGIIYKIGRFLAQSKEMDQVVILKKDPSGNIRYRIDAEQASWMEGRWIFYNGIKRVFGEEGSVLEEAPFSTLPTEIRDNPEHFGKDTRKIKNMTLREGYSYYKIVRRMGLDYKSLLTKYHRKIASSFTVFLVVIIGLSIGSMPFKNALVISFSVTLMTVLTFLFLVEIGYTFGSSGKISPVIGGWLGNIIFLLICVYLLRRVRV